MKKNRISVLLPLLSVVLVIVAFLGVYFIKANDKKEDTEKTEETVSEKDAEETEDSTTVENKDAVNDERNIDKSIQKYSFTKAVVESIKSDTEGYDCYSDGVFNYYVNQKTGYLTMMLLGSDKGTKPLGDPAEELTAYLKGLYPELGISKEGWKESESDVLKFLSYSSEVLGVECNVITFNLSKDGALLGGSMQLDAFATVKDGQETMSSEDAVVLATGYVKAYIDSNKKYIKSLIIDSYSVNVKSSTHGGNQYWCVEFVTPDIYNDQLPLGFLCEINAKDGSDYTVSDAK